MVKINMVGRSLNYAAAMHAYIPIDRRIAMVANESLPLDMAGAAMFADISGFTPLTELLLKAFGPQRGAEEITLLLNRVYNELINEVHRFHGVVISFAGDAIMCWFGGDDGRRAVAAAVAMQERMRPFQRFAVPGLEAPVEFAVKITISLGSVKRFVVGSPHIQLLDFVTGDPVNSMAVLQKLVQPGKILVDHRVAIQLEQLLDIHTWQTDQYGHKTAVINGLLTEVKPQLWSPDVAGLAPERLEPWILPAVLERLRLGQGEYLAELRSCVALFLSFEGLNYIEDEQVDEKLDTFIRMVQSRMLHYEGALLQISTGDKGSYLYGTFGAPIMHEDDSNRALAAALALRQEALAFPFITGVRIGISRGLMRVGAYGADSRRIYGAMGDETNMAARLMQRANNGEILVTGRIIAVASPQFQFGNLGVIALKGKQEPIPLFLLQNEHELADSARPLAHFEQAMVGRKAEVDQFAVLFNRFVTEHTTQILYFEGEAGSGKTRLVAQCIENIKENDQCRILTGYGDPLNRGIPYYGWHGIFQTLLGLRDISDRAIIQAAVLDRIAEMNPDWIERAPLLNAVLHINLPESSLTEQMYGKSRADNSKAFMLAILKHELISSNPYLFILEDTHFFDTASWSMTHAVIQEDYPLFILMSGRPFNEIDEQLPMDFKAVLDRSDCIKMQVGALSHAEAKLLLTQRLGCSKLPKQLVELIWEKAEGNPFFTEELALSLLDGGLLQVENDRCQIVGGIEHLQSAEIPDSLQGVILNRIDHLPLQPQLAIKVASVIGRFFDHKLLHDIYPVAEDRENLTPILQDLQRRKLLMQDRSGSSRYQFRQQITQETIYNLMTFTQRRQLHRAIGVWYETEHVNDLYPHAAALAYHWLRAEENGTAVPYLAMAGEQALANYANKEAVRLFTQLLKMVGGDQSAISYSAEQRSRWYHNLATGYYGLGMLQESIDAYREALRLVNWPVPMNAFALRSEIVKELLAQGKTRLLGQRKIELSAAERGLYQFGYQLYEQFSETSFLLNETEYTVYGTLKSLNLAEKLGPSPQLARGYAGVSIACGLIPFHPLAKKYQELALHTLTTANDPVTRANVLWVIGLYAIGVGDWDQSRSCVAEAESILRHAGHWDRWGICMEMLGRLAYHQSNMVEMSTNAVALMQRASQRDDLVHQAWSLLNQAEVLLLRGEGIEGSFPLLDEALRFLVASAEPGSVIKGYALRAVAHGRLGAFTEMQADATTALTLIQQTKPTSFGGFAGYAATAEAFWQLTNQFPGKYEAEFEKALRALQSYASIFPIGVPRAELYAGCAKLLRGQSRAAIRIWKRGLRAAEKLQMPFDSALIYLFLAEHLPEKNADKGHYSHLAESQFTKLGNQYEAKIVKLMLADEEDSGAFIG